jgi:PAS domain S-box-containing protein
MTPIYQGIVDHAQDAIIYADREGVIRLWNRGAEIIFGYAAAEALGQSLALIIPPKYRHAHDEGYRHAIHSGTTRYDGRVMTTRAQHKYGSRLYVDMSFGLLKDEAGRVTGAFTIARDSTARHLEEIARRVAAEAHAA